MTALDREVRAVLGDHPSCCHPGDDRLSGLYGSILHETLDGDPLHQRNVTVFADGQVDRSPCGSGTSARLALLHHLGMVDVGQAFQNRGLAGGEFTGRVVATTGDTVTTTIEGSAYRHATSTFHLDRHDPLGSGFLFR